jgi:hypothetical protein
VTAAAVNSVQVEALRLLIDQIDSLAFSGLGPRLGAVQLERELMPVLASIRSKQSPSAVVAAERAGLMAGEAARWLRMLEAELAAVRVGLLQDLQAAKGGAP